MKTEEIRTTYEVALRSELPERWQGAVALAEQMTERSYAPYSRFCVGAGLLLSDGTLVGGCNQENAAFPVCMCAERSALFAAGAQHPGVSVEALAIIARNDAGLVAEPVSPCGSCRQALLEFEVRQGRDISVLLCSRSEVIVFGSVKALLPFSFTQIEN